jgi:hypothetical protein
MKLQMSFPHTSSVLVFLFFIIKKLAKLEMKGKLVSWTLIIELKGNLVGWTLTITLWMVSNGLAQLS